MKIKRVWKKELGDKTMLPKGARPIHVERGFIWFEVDDVDAPNTLPVYLVGTGQGISSAWLHIGTYLDDPFVWHVYADHSGQKI